VAARSAGILLHRTRAGVLEVLLVHPGGPLWARRDSGAWSVPKGEYTDGEDALAAARREFEEELGVAPPDGPVEDLGEVRQKSGKIVRAWALRGELTSEPIQQAGHRPDKEARTEAAAVVGLPEVEQDRQEDDCDRQEDRPARRRPAQPAQTEDDQKRDRTARDVARVLIAQLDATCLARPFRAAESPG